MELTKEIIDKLYPSKDHDEMTVGDLINSLLRFPSNMIVRTTYENYDKGATLMTEKIRSVEMVGMINSPFYEGDVVVIGDTVVSSRYKEYVNIENTTEVVVLSKYKEISTNS